MSINKKEEDKLQHDVKRISLGLRMIAEEDDRQKRKFLYDLMDLEVKRIFEDISELVDNSGGE